MKIEMDSNSSLTIITISICATIAVIVFMIYRYSVTAYEKGYTQQQLQNSQMTMWVKP